VTTPAAVPATSGRTNYLKRINSKVAKRAMRVLWEQGHRHCAYCDKPIEFWIEAKLYAPPSATEPHAGEYEIFTLSDNTRAVVGHKVCPLPKQP
jgi:hypothetical protein